MEPKKKKTDSRGKQKGIKENKADEVQKCKKGQIRSPAAVLYRKPVSTPRQLAGKAHGHGV